MAISFTRYIDIISSVGGATLVNQRDLNLRIFSTNPLIPTETVITFDTAAEVGAYFGTSSEEYLRAVFYFGWISKNTTTPQALSFWFWPSAATAPLIFGSSSPSVIGAWASITTGSFALTLGGVLETFTDLDFSAAVTFAEVAAIVQAAIRTGSGALWTSATVTYDVTTNSFDFVGGAAGAANVIVSLAGSGQDITGMLGWLGTTGIILSNGVAAETVATTLQNSANASNNFGSFIFTTAAALSLTNIEAAAAWNVTQNVLYQYHVPVSAANASAWSAALLGYAGLGLTLAPLSGEYPEMAPTMILAATNYDVANSTQNYMFQQFNLTPSVTTDTAANTYDALLINYYGVTQTAGQQLAFYQRGILMGPSSAPLDMNTYANEQWLKDAATAQILNLMLALPKISANTKGQGQITTQLLAIVQEALSNGVISVGKPLNVTQQLYITEITNNNRAWYNVQNLGYYLTTTIGTFTAPTGRTEYEITYLLVYSKDDVVRFVEGQHVLI